MNQTELNRALQIIREIEHNGKNLPKSIIEIPELAENYSDFNEILKRIDNNVLKLSIPNFKLFGIHDFIVPKKEQRITQFFLLFPYLLTIIFSIYGVFSGNYWLFITFIVAILTPMFSSMLSGFFSIIILIGLSVYFFNSDNTLLGFITLTIFISTICTKYLKIHRRNTLIKIAKSNEEFFCFLFYNRTIAIYDEKIKGMLYSK